MFRHLMEDGASIAFLLRRLDAADAPGRTERARRLIDAARRAGLRAWPGSPGMRGRA